MNKLSSVAVEVWCVLGLGIFGADGLPKKLEIDCCFFFTDGVAWVRNEGCDIPVDLVGSRMGRPRPHYCMESLSYLELRVGHRRSRN